MKQLFANIYALRIWKETKGQDMIEYGLMAGFLAVAAVVFMPTFTASIAAVFTRIGTSLAGAGV